jgi:hypothetical protein
MENLEEYCLERLNNILFKFDLQVVKHTVESQIKYVLLDIQTKHNISVYKSINELLFSSLPIFHDLSKYNSCASFFISHCNNIAFPKIAKRCIRYINAYNNIKNLENTSSLEELAIKMDLLGI